MNRDSIFQAIKDICKGLEQEFDLISNERKSVLEQLKNYIVQKYKEGKSPQVIVICTHNSRRSHMGQLWLALATEFYGLPKTEIFSGGTEATAFNFRAVQAFQRIGFNISTENESANNPIYRIQWKNEMPPYLAFSKKYDAFPNPTNSFAAILVCSEADEACPAVLGCDFRLAIPYDDPKAFDDTELETDKYKERVRQIGREMLYVLSQIHLS